MSLLTEMKQIAIDLESQDMDALNIHFETNGYNISVYVNRSKDVEEIEEE